MYNSCRSVFVVLVLGSLRFCFGWVTSPVSRSTLLYMTNNDDEALRFKQQAEKLRREIENFKRIKREAETEQERQMQEEQGAKEKLRNRYSAVVPILKPDGKTVDERVYFTPKLSNGTSSILVLEVKLPLGIILGENEVIPFTTVVDEVADGSNGELAGIRQGDIFRACSACRIEMELPTWQIMAGGIGIPKTKRFMYSIDGRPFEEVMNAIASNRQDPEQRPVVIVVERKD